MLAGTFVAHEYPFMGSVARTGVDMELTLYIDKISRKKPHRMELLKVLWLYSRFLIQFPAAVRELHIATTIFAYSTVGFAYSWVRFAYSNGKSMHIADVIEGFS